MPSQVTYRRYATYRDALEKPEPEFFTCRRGCRKRIHGRKHRAVHEWFRHDAPHPDSDADFNRRVDACAECHMGENYAELCSVHAKEAGWGFGVYAMSDAVPSTVRVPRNNYYDKRLGLTIWGSYA